MGKTILGNLFRPRRPSNGSLGDIGVRLEARMGKIPFSGRYHREPRRIEEDYTMLQSVLGSGYNGEVRMATSVSKPGQKFAVKSLQLGSSTRQQFLGNDDIELLEAEVENYLSIDHPHIARLYDVYESKQELHLVMECMEGGELFDRIIAKKRFSEVEASDALRQMLLALNYIHSHGIVHRDVKLENFVYDSKSSGTLKLIDFGFSSRAENLNESLGTLSYVAPEVLQRSYTSQCDMWSLGVCGFIMLLGYMPFNGKTETEQKRKILAGKYAMRPDKWSNVSAEAKDFIEALLEVDPSKRLTAQQALEHPWIARSLDDNSEDVPMQPCCDALLRFSRASKFRRCCLEMLAWSLSNQDRAKVRDCFLSLDTNQQGTITLQELKHVMVDKLHLVDEQEVLNMFQAMDYNHDLEIHYSDFLAAMVDGMDGMADVDDEVLSDTFRRFDTDGSGYITVENLRDVLGSMVEGENVDSFIAEADQTKDGRLCFAEFAAYLRRARIHDIDNFMAVDEGGTHKLRLPSSKPPKRSSMLKSALKGLGLMSL